MTLARPVFPATTALENAPLLSLVYLVLVWLCELSLWLHQPSLWEYKLQCLHHGSLLLNQHKHQHASKCSYARASPHLARSVPVGPAPWASSVWIPEITQSLVSPEATVLEEALAAPSVQV
jgi:hypothetical protein